MNFEYKDYNFRLSMYDFALFDYYLNSWKVNKKKLLLSKWFSFYL